MMIPVLLGVTTIIFTMMYLTPGDPALQLLGDNATPEAIQQLHEEMGLDDPYIVRLGNYFKQVFLHGDLGTSYINRKPVLQELLARFPNTFKLTICSVCISILIGIPLGTLSATKQYSFGDQLGTTLSLIGVSLPTFWLGLMMIVVFAVKLGWLPASGSYGPEYWILPSLTIGINASANIMRTTRATMLEVIRQDYIRGVRAKGQTEGKTIWGHALRNSLIPIVTVVGLEFGSMLGGAVLIESIFSIPGMGKYVVDAIRNKDFPVVQGGVLFIALMFAVVNLMIDILYAFIDPKIKAQYQRGKKRTRKNVKEDSENEQ